MPPRRARDPEYLERRIYFYRLLPVGRVTPPLAYDPLPVLEELRRLLGTDDRYDVRGERVTLVIPDDGTRPRLRILNVRRTDLPQMESAGVLAPLPLDRAAGIADQIHVAFFPGDVIGSEFNFYGPRVTRLAEFLRSKAIGPRFRVAPLIRDDAVRQFEQMDELRSARLKIHRSATGLLARHDATLAQALDRTAEYADGATLELTWRRAPRSHESLSGRVRALFRALAADPDRGDVVKALQVEGRNPETENFELLDLVKEEVGTIREIRRLEVRSRVLDSADAYRAIDSAYEQLANEIERAGTIAESEN